MTDGYGHDDEGMHVLQSDPRNVDWRPLWTPGPWSFRGSSESPSPDQAGDFAIRDGEGCIIAETYRMVDHGVFRPSAANAQLISVAPDMAIYIRDVMGYYTALGGLYEEGIMVSGRELLSKIGVEA